MLKNSTAIMKTVVQKMLTAIKIISILIIQYAKITQKRLPSTKQRTGKASNQHSRLSSG